MPPFFSILTAAYNAEEFMEETISTMFSQTCKDWEWIITNDASTDRTWEIVTRLTAGHPNVRLFQNPQNLGQRENLNKCLEKAEGKWVGYLHADDGYRPHTLQTIYDYVKDREEMVMWTHSRIAVGKGKIPDVIVPYKYHTEFSSEEFADLHYLRGCIFGGMSNYFFRRPDPSKKITFSDGSYWIDLRFYMRQLKAFPQGRAIFHPDVLSFMTEHPDSVSSDAGRTHMWLPDMFTIPRDLGDLDWSVRVRLLQILRLIKCWFKFLPQMPPGTRFLAFESIGSIIASFFRPRRNPPLSP